jgi:hypothetical protein
MPTTQLKQLEELFGGRQFVTVEPFLAHLPTERRQLQFVWIPASTFPAFRPDLNRAHADYVAVLVGPAANRERFILFTCDERIHKHAVRIEGEEAIRLAKLWLHARLHDEVIASPRWGALLRGQESA